MAHQEIVYRYARGKQGFFFYQSVQIDYGIHPEMTVNFVGSHYGEIYEALNS